MIGTTDTLYPTAFDYEVQREAIGREGRPAVLIPKYRNLLKGIGIKQLTDFRVWDMRPGYLCIWILGL